MGHFSELIRCNMYIVAKACYADKHCDGHQVAQKLCIVVAEISFYLYEKL